MSDKDLVSRGDAKDALYMCVHGVTTLNGKKVLAVDLAEAINRLNAIHPALQQTVNVNPVVLCKNCKHYNDGWCYNPNTYDDEKTRGNTDPDWYCADGEMKEHEMTAREYLEADARMREYYGLPSAFNITGMSVDKAIKIVEEWVKKHPERTGN